MITAAKDLHRRSSMVQFSHKSFAARPFRPLLAGAVFGLTLASGLSTAAASNTIVVGAIAGHAAVSATGAATYTIPISLPPGTNGMQPSLALVYNSQSGEGLAGYGWTISGLSAITRCPWTIDDGGKTQGVEFGTVAGGHSDKFCLDGQRLLQTNNSANYGANGMTYNTTINNYAVITSVGTSGNSGGTNGPDHFTVQTKDGRIYEYGNTTDSRIQAQWQGGTIRVWALDKVTDLNGNYIKYTYGGSGDGGNGFNYWLTSISYTGNGSTAPDHLIQFNYSPRSAGSVTAQYQYGNLVTNSQLLSSIQISYAGTPTSTTTAFTYTLGYGQDSANGRNQLSSVQECAVVNAGQPNCFNPTNIYWQSAQSGWSGDTQTGWATTDQAHAAAAHLMDVDGDGIQDLVYPAPISPGSGTYDWFVMFGQPGGGLSAPVDTGDVLWGSTNYYQYALAADVNGDGRMDLLVPTPTGWQVYVSTGNRTPGMGGIFTTPANNLPNLGGNNSVTNQPIYQGNVWAVDFSGRGFSDLLYDDGVNIFYLKNNEYSGSANYAAAVNILGLNSITKPTNVSFVDVPLDFDGSGRGGMLVASTQAGANVLKALTSAEPPPALNLLGGSSGVEQGSSPMPADSNGDGLTDLFYVLDNGAQWMIGLSTGTGFNNVATGVIADTTSGLDAVVADYDGSGRQTAIVHSTDGNWYAVGSLYNGGNAFVVNKSTVSAPYPSSYVQGTLRIGNIEANGMDDLVYGVLNPNNGNVRWDFSLHKGLPWAADTVTDITDGFGNFCNFHYESLTNGAPFYTEGSSAQNPTRDIQPAMQVVSDYEESAGTGSANKYTFTYSGAQTDLQGRGFLGFASRTITDVFSGTTETVKYAQAFPQTGLVTADTVVSNSSNATVSDVENTGVDSLQVSEAYGIAYLPFFDKSVASRYSYNGSGDQVVSQTTTSVSASDFDTYGNYNGQSTASGGKQTTVVLGTAAYVQGTAGQFAINNSTTYAAPNASTHCVGLPQTTLTVRDSVAGSATRTSTGLEVDTAYCRMESLQLSGGSDTGATTTFTYDNDTMNPIPSGASGPFGNLVETQVSGANISPAPRTTVYSYTGGNGEFPTSVSYTVSSNLTLTTQSSWEYSLGFKLSDTDANGKPTTYAPDAFGRLASVTRPDGTQTQYAYQWCTDPSIGMPCPTTGEYEVTTTQVSNDYSTTHASVVTGYTAYDSRSRPVRQGTKLLGGVLSLVDTTYEKVGLGHVISVTRPYFSGASTVYQTSYTWDDAFDRLTTVTAPANASDSNSSGNVTQFSYNVVSTGTPLGFAVTASSTSTASSLAENTAKYTDALGEVTTMVDANGGQTLYSYDAFGDLTQTTDADGKQTTLGYDGLGHKTSMIDPDMGQWGYQVDALGEVLCQTDADTQSIIMGYDGLGRVTSKLATAPGGGCTATTGTASSWSYDQTGALGLPATVSDSNGFQRSYGYDTLERPNVVTTTISGTPYSVSTSYDDFSRVATVTYPTSVSPATDSTPTAVATASPNPYALGTSGGVTLDGSGSTDPAGGTLQYQWSQTAGVTVSFNAAAQKPSFTPTATGTYSFQLQVIDSESTLSAPVNISVTVNAARPGAPTANSPNYTGTVGLSWSNVPGGALYKVYESTDGTNFSLLPNPVTGTSTSIPGLTDGNYYFEIQACDSNGNFCSAVGPVSSAINVLLPPNPPTGLSFSAPTVSTTGSYTLYWNGSATATSYKVYLSNNSLQCTTSNTNCPFSGKGNGTYTYYVVAINAAGPGTGSAQASKTVQLPPGTPGASVPSPQSVYTQDPFTLSWGGASGIVQYYIINGGTTHYTGLSASLTAPRTGGSFPYFVQACNVANGQQQCGPNSGAVPLQVTLNTGCRTCSPTGGAAPPAPISGNSAAPSGSTHGRPMAVILPLDLPEQSRSLQPLPVAPVNGTLSALAHERRVLVAAQPRQPREAMFAARAERLALAQLPTLLPPAPGKDVAAWNASEMSRLSLDPKAPVFAPPAYIAYGGARVAPATGTPYQFAVQYNYDPSSGALESVQDAQTMFYYWRAATGMGVAPVDAFGHLLGYVDGNNVSTVSSFDQATGAITGIDTGIGPSDAVQDLVYSWDGFGNLQQRCDINRQLYEGFSYDNLNRLKTSNVYTQATVSESASPNCSAGTAGAAVGVNYDPVGNIQNLTNSGNAAIGGTYTYDPNHSHAVSAVTNIPGTNTYDANGNMVCRFGTWNGTTCSGGTQITWNADNLPTCIDTTGEPCTGSTGVSQFQYGPDNQRYSQTATDAARNTTTTIYIGSQFEVMSNASGIYYRHNIMAGGGVVAVHTIDQSGNVRTAYTHSDHLGSMDVVTDDTGNIATDPVTGEQQVMSFDAFGLRRDPTNWAYDLTTAQIGGLKAKTDRGYTYQEQLDNVGLVHMNGRVYDPSVGRFISADPIQALNRYSYVGNNPLRYTDPSGYCFAGCFWQPSTQANAVSNLASGTLNTAGHIVDTAFNHLPEIAALVIAYYTGDWANLGDTFWGSVGTGAVDGAAFGASDTALRGGNGSQILHNTFRGAEVGAIGGGLAYGANLSTTYFGNYVGQYPAGVISYGTAGGLTSEAAGGSFNNGFGFGALAYTAQQLYYLSINHNGVHEDPQWSGGQDAVIKQDQTPGQETQANMNPGIATTTGGPVGSVVQDPCGDCEGSTFSQIINAIPGGNAFSTFHDVIGDYSQLYLGGFPTVLNYAMLPPAIVLTYTALIGTTPIGMAMYGSYEYGNNH